MRISEFNFVHNGNSYLVRSSYCPNNPKSCNQLIGDDFVSVDLNQDRIMDKVTKGNINLSEAQEIYEYCLNLLEREGKLNEISNKTNEFTLKESDYTFCIKSFFSNDSPFNQFTIVEKRAGFNQDRISIFIDHESDGKLNEVLKGGFLIETAQLMYKKTIDSGLKQGKLREVNENIFVK